MRLLLEWVLSNKVEICGTASGLVYVWLSIRQNLHTWTVGIITSLLYCWVFFDTKLYAQVGLQVYYVFISIYGWWSWHSSGRDVAGKKKLHVSHTQVSLWVKLIIINFGLTLSIYYFTDIYTDDSLPSGDAIIASLSVIATWMLARKKIEQWILWIVIDLFSISLYLYRGLYPTVFLFLAYTVMAIIGFYKWRKDLVRLKS